MLKKLLNIPAITAEMLFPAALGVEVAEFVDNVNSGRERTQPMYLRMKELLERRHCTDYVRLKCNRYGPTRTKQRKPVCRACNGDTLTTGHLFVCAARSPALIRLLTLAQRKHWW